MNDKTLFVGGEPFFMKGAEFHYFRTPKKLWGKHLAKIAECGMNTVTACMPWYFHEPEAGLFDFDGTTKPERDLCGLIDMVEEAGLKLVAHPGPFLNCEFRHGGIPKWLFENYPETLSRKADGEPVPGRPVPAEGEERYREFVKRWYNNVVPIFAERQASKGGPVILFQPDNELSAAWSYGLLNSLYDPKILSELWPEWLRSKYVSIEIFNAEHCSQFSQFDEVQAPKRFPDTDEERGIAVEWMEFKRRFLASWGATMAEWAKELGMETPMIFNEPVAGFYGHGDHAGFGSALEECGINGATVCHSYSERMLDLEGTLNPTLGIELIKSSPLKAPPMSVEINCAWNIPRLSRTAANWDPLMRSLLGHGLKGYSVFTFSEAHADLGDSINGPDYFADAGLTLDGEPAPAYERLERFNRLLLTWEPEILAAENRDDATLCYSPAFRIFDFLGAKSCMNEQNSAQGPGGDAFDAEPGLDKGDSGPSHDWLTGYENISKQSVPPEASLWMRFKEAYILLTKLNISFNLLDLKHPNKKTGEATLIVPCVGTLEKSAIDYLVKHIEKDGKVLFFPTIPWFDEFGKRDSRIADKLGISVSERVRPAGGTLLDYGARVLETAFDSTVAAGGWIWIHEFPQNSENLASYDGKSVTARVENVVISGIDAAFTTYASLDFWDKVTKESLEINPFAKTPGNRVHIKTLIGEKGGFAMVANLQGDTAPTTVKLGDASEFPLELGESESRILPFNVLLDGKRLIHSTSEIIRSSDGNKYELHGVPGTKGELLFAEAILVKINDTTITPTHTQSGFKVEYVHGIKPLAFTIEPTLKTT